MGWTRRPIAQLEKKKKLPKPAYLELSPPEVPLKVAKPIFVIPRMACKHILDAKNRSSNLDSRFFR